MNLLTAAFVFILASPILATILAHIVKSTQPKPRVIWSDQGRIYLDGEDVTDLRIRSMENNHG